MNINKAPYFDDYDFKKNYKHILFKSGLPAQTRELNQIQSIMRGELGALSDHVFKNGSKVSNCRTSLYQREYVRLMEKDEVDNDIYDPQFKAKLVGETSEVEAVLTNFINMTENDPYTINVIYTRTGKDGIQKTFIPGEWVKVLNDDGVVLFKWKVRCPSCVGSTLSPEEINPVGKSFYFSVDEGIVYYNHMFVYVNQQEILITKYIIFNSENFPITNEKFKIGLDIDIKIINALDDINLYDNSLGYPNVSAEGADRLYVNPILIKRSYDSIDGDTFILFAKYKENYNAEYVKSDSDYNDLMKEFARRTYESSGNFTVSPFTGQVFNEKKESPNDPLGISVNGDPTKYVVNISPGIAYVDGYRVEKDSNNSVTGNKSVDTTKENNFAVTLDARQYITVNVITQNTIFNNTFDNNILGYKEILLYDGIVANGNVSGTQIGVAKVSDQSYVKDNLYNVYLYDINITNTLKSISDVKSLKVMDGTIIAETVLNDGATTLYNADSSGLIYNIPLTDIKSLRSNQDSNAGSISIKVRRKLVGTLDASGKISFTGSNNEYFEGLNSNNNIMTINNVTHKINTSEYMVNNNTLTLDLGVVNAGKNIIFLADLTRFEQTERTKVYTKKTLTTSIKPKGTVGDIVKLGLADVYKINHIKIVDPSQPSFVAIDVTNEYTFNNGQTLMYYGESTIIRNKNRSNIIDSHRLEISFDYFEHQGNQGYFTVDSYKQILNDNILTYEQLPTISVNGKTNRLTESIDFRPIFINNVYINTPVIPVQNSTFVADIEHYLPRIDIIQISKDGYFTIKPGIPSMNPVAPDVDPSNMKIFNVYVSAYVYNIMKDISLEFIENKRYTMKEIGKINQRLTSLEYYVTLSQLEQNTLNQNITDVDGLTRYKNGFIVDDFTKFQAADVTNKYFKASLDRKRGELRPFFDVYSIDMIMDKAKSINVNLAGNIAMLPYVEVSELVNPYATKSVSINPYLIFNKEGSVILTPNIDTWADDTYLPHVSTSIDTGVKALQDINSFNQLVGTEWGSWRNLNTTVQRVESVDRTSSSINQDNGISTTNTTTTNIQTTTTALNERSGVSRSINSRTDSFTVDNVVKDVRIIPYIRPRIIEFYASKLKPNTILHVLFDGVDVTKHCRIKRSIGNNELTTPLFSDFGGSPIVTDENGEVIGEFRIPAETFFTGEKQFVLSDSITSTSDATTSAKTKYFAGGVNQTKQNNTLNIVSPVVTSVNVSEQNSISNVTNDVRVTSETLFTATPPTPPVVADIVPNRNESVTQISPVTSAPTAITPSTFSGSSSFSRDPIAQGFQVAKSCFITTIEIFFQQVDVKTSDNIWVEIRTMLNGYPSNEVIAHKDYSPMDIVNFVSNDASKGFKVIFNQPIYVDSTKNYCFVVGGHSPDTKIWVSRLGDEVVNVKGKIVEEPPSLNPSFRSLNGSTWNAEQFEFIKYTIYRAEFTQSQMKIVMTNSDTDSLTLKTLNPIEVQQGSNRVRIHALNHGVSVNEKVGISLFDGLPVIVSVSNNTPPQIGQTLKTPSGSGIITSVESMTILNQYSVKMKDVRGIFKIDEYYQCDPIVKTYNDFILFANGNKSKQNIQVTECQGTIISNITDGLGFTNIANVSIENFNKEHVVVEIDSSDSFIIEVPGTFTQSGRYGNLHVTLYGMSRKYESFTLSGEYLSYTAAEKFTIDAIDMDYNKQKETIIDLSMNNYNSKPLKLASKINEKTILGSEKSLTLNMYFSSNDSRISPMINLESLTFTGISNAISNNTNDKFNVIPNRENRYKSEKYDDGSEPYRYITQKVILKNPATDIRIYLDIYKDIEADYDIYIKMGNGDTVNSESNLWTPLDKINKSKISSGINNFIEHEFNLSSDSSVYDGKDFIWFRVKIVGKSKNSAKPPIFKNFRAIALT